MIRQINDTNEKKYTQTMKDGEYVIDIDLGNFFYKVIYDNGRKKSYDFSNVERVKPGSDNAFLINGESYVFGPNAKIKYDTNKICEEKKALLARVLYGIVPDKARVKLVTLLPLSLYINAEDGNKEEFAQLLKGKYTVENPEGFKKTFTVTDVEVFCESFSSIITEPTLMNKPLYLLDLGGVDWSGVFVYGRPDANKKFNNTTGMNMFYSKLGDRLTSITKKTYDPVSARLIFEKYTNMEQVKIDAIKDEEKKTRTQNIKNTVDAFSREYIKTHIYEELYKIGYDEDIYSLVFVGGGAKALRKYLEEDENATIVKDALFSNVEGARRMAIARSQRKANAQAQSKVGVAK